MAQQPSGDEAENQGAPEGGDTGDTTEKNDAPPATPGEGEPDTDEEEEEESDSDDPSKLTIPVRSSYSASEVIARQKRQIDKLKGKQQEESDDAEGEEEEDGERLSPEAARALSREVRKATEPIAHALARQSDEKELQELFASDPAAKSYEKRIRAFMGHEAYRNVPAVAIYHHLHYEAAKKAASEKRSKADREAGHSRTGGHPTRTRSDFDKLTAEGISDMSDEQFAELQQRVKTGQFK